MLRCSEYSDLVFDIIGAAMEVHRVLKHGLAESIYQEALCIELASQGISCQCESAVPVYYTDNVLTKPYRIDVMVGDIILELKSVSQIVPAHRAQLRNYLRLTRKPLGLLINFGEKSLVGERWAYDKETNDCLLVNRQMHPVGGLDYSSLLDE